VLDIAVALLPVVTFLLLLIAFDSFKLVPKDMIAGALFGGAAAAFAAAWVHGRILDTTGIDTEPLSRYVAPFTVETLQALVLVVPFARRQIGFLVDATIVAFAVGTGFAVVENVEYLRDLSASNVWIWIARGFGTAILHGATTTIVALVAKSLVDRGRALPIALAPGWAAAVVLHSLFNHVLVSPILAAAMLMLVLPLAVLAVFSQSERKTREWVGAGLDLDVELLQLVKSAAFGGTRLGRYLAELRARFPGPVVADMFCLLQLDLELSIRVKGMLLAREAGLEVPIDDGLRARLSERAYLERAIGRTGLIALRPLQVTSDRDRWHRHLLRQARTGRRQK
jgi:RsiW-degrading membrane proteinase PrsW (M82 family)